MTAITTARLWPSLTSGITPTRRNMQKRPELHVQRRRLRLSLLLSCRLRPRIIPTPEPPLPLQNDRQWIVKGTAQRIGTISPRLTIYSEPSSKAAETSSARTPHFGRSSSIRCPSPWTLSTQSSYIEALLDEVDLGCPLTEPPSGAHSPPDEGLSPYKRSLAKEALGSCGTSGI